jgi:hypothetical protein
MSWLLSLYAFPICILFIFSEGGRYFPVTFLSAVKSNAKLVHNHVDLDKKGMENLESIVISVCIFGSVVLVVFIIAKYTYLIKKALADRGMPPSTAKINYLEIGCIVLGIGLGIGLSSIFTVMNLPEDTMDLLVWSVISIGGGLGLFASHFMRKKIEEGK